MGLKLQLTFLVAIALLCHAYAGVLRGEDGAQDSVKAAVKDAVETTSVSPKKTTTTTSVPATTPKSLLKNVPLAIALTRDEFASIKLPADSEDPAYTTAATLADEERATTPENLFKDVPLAVALSEDEDASIRLSEAAIDPAPGTDSDTELLSLENSEDAEVVVPKVEKSAKLLLLSAPKRAEKAKEPEENIEEPEEIDDAGGEALTTTTATDLAESTTLAEQLSVEENDADTAKPTTLVTKLYAINDTLSADYTQASNSEQSSTAQPEDAAVAVDSKVSSESTEAPDAVPAEQAAAPNGDNIGSALLIETEADYVLLDADVEQFGSFTHENSAVHLQPLVQSVEIVPTHVDDPFIVNYVHHGW